MSLAEKWVLEQSICNSDWGTSINDVHNVILFEAFTVLG